jgi:hypothetical protein
MKNEELIKKVAEYFGYQNTLTGRTRRGDVIIIRHCVWYVMRYDLGMNVKSIGVLFNRDHSTVVHGCRNIDLNRDINDPIAGVISRNLNIIRAIYNGDDLNQFYEKIPYKQHYREIKKEKHKKVAELYRAKKKSFETCTDGKRGLTKEGLEWEL